MTTKKTKPESLTSRVDFHDKALSDIINTSSKIVDIQGTNVKALNYLMDNQRKLSLVVSVLSTFIVVSTASLIIAYYTQ